MLARRRALGDFPPRSPSSYIQLGAGVVARTGAIRARVCAAGVPTPVLRCRAAEWEEACVSAGDVRGQYVGHGDGGRVFRFTACDGGEWAFGVSGFARVDGWVLWVGDDGEHFCGGDEGVAIEACVFLWGWECWGGIGGGGCDYGWCAMVGRV